ncbi:MAG: gliding motility-associated ABC transporter substrate-binding protein GldG [Bacteroidales bacterium]|nr:gliding motility-associated ABC transporter substrate-binding protein GldG [Bacteroidales bacterium]
MKALLQKEIRQFFSGPAAYLVLTVFYVSNALMLFVLPTGFNIFDAGYATLEPYFSWAPWVFLFLIPALCMRSFSEEKKTGTMEVLLTRPLSSGRIVFAKYISCIIILAICLLPTFIYLYTVSSLARPVGNIDLGAFWGASLGLLLLGAAFAAVSLFMSSLTDNQVVAFVLGAGACAVLYVGFDLFGAATAQGGRALAVGGLGIRAHYLSLSRGVIDLRDLFYYAGVVTLFLALCVWRVGIRRFAPCLTAIIVAVIANVAVSFLPLRIDLTADRRYTLLPLTKQILKSNREPVLVNVYLTGNLPAGFKRLEKAVRETLDEFRVYHPSLRYTFIDLYDMEDEGRRQARMQALAEAGVQPTQLEVKTKEGMTRRLVFPAAEIRYGGAQAAVGLLAEQWGRGAEETLNMSVENLEIQLIGALRALFAPPTQSVAFLEGQGEFDALQTYSFQRELGKYYQTARVPLTDSLGCLLRRDSAGAWLPRYTALVVAHPTLPFGEAQKYVIDQYVMHGGRVMWLVDAGNGSLDSLRGERLFNAMPYDLRLEDMFFRYGFRLRADMILDKNAAPSPMVTAYQGSRPVIEYIPNYYCPVVEAEGVGAVRLQVVSGLDTLENAVRKTPLLVTSDYSYKIRLPHAMSADLMRNDVDVRRFRDRQQMVALLLEGVFPSAYPLVKPAVRGAEGFVPRRESVEGAMMIAGDGDLARNDIIPQTFTPMPLGLDRYTLQQYGNGDFLMNGMHYLCGNMEYGQLKARAVKLRLLDKTALNRARRSYTLLNFLLPLACLALFGGLFLYLRRKRYSRCS